MKTLREQVHRANITRYQHLLACDSTPYERRYLEEMIEQERSAIMRLQNPRTARHSETRDDARLAPSTHHANSSH